MIPISVRERYYPPLPLHATWTAATGRAVASLLVYDWRLTDAEKVQLLTEWHIHELGDVTKTARRSALSAVANLASWPHALALSAVARPLAGYVPCASCGLVVQPCPSCGECPGCADDARRESWPSCGHCADCVSLCDECSECTSCDGACTCTRCEGCDRVRDLCSGCRQCERCCECMQCNHCGDVCETTCYHEDDDNNGTCPGDLCEACCSYGRRAPGSSYVIEGRPRARAAASPADRRHFRSQRLAGVEIEYTSCERFAPIAGYAETHGASVHADGSCGWEVVTPPAAGDHLLKQLDTVCSALSSASAEHDDSCGVHVHVDVRDFRWADIARLTLLWEYLETTMYRLAGQGRADNSYCKPWNGELRRALAHAPHDPKGAILSCVLTNSKDPKKRLEQHWRGSGPPCKKGIFDRYRSMNLSPWLARIAARRASRMSRPAARREDATVEFRLHEDCHDAARLVPWTMLLVRIVEYALAHSEKEIAMLPSPVAALRVIAPDARIGAYLIAREITDAPDDRTAPLFIVTVAPASPTVFDFGDGRGSVPAHRHANGGGWVADTAHVSGTAYVSGTAHVYDDAHVFGGAQVYGDARVHGDAQVYGDAHVSGGEITEGTCAA